MDDDRRLCVYRCDGDNFQRDSDSSLHADLAPDPGQHQSRRDTYGPCLCHSDQRRRFVLRKAVRLNTVINRGQIALINRRGGQNSSAFVRGLNPAAWFRFNTGITVTGAGVSAWADQSGNARDLLQGTDAARPPKQADGSILFDGVAQFLKCGSFTLNQPETVYLLFKQVAWTLNARISDGNANGTGSIDQSPATPQLVINAGSAVATNGNLAVGAYGVAAAVFNGASSSLRINNTAETTGNAGAANMSGFTVGGAASGVAFSNIQVKEVVLFAAAHDAATRQRVIRYLAQVGGLNI